MSRRHWQRPPSHFCYTGFVKLSAAIAAAGFDFFHAWPLRNVSQSQVGRNFSSGGAPVPAPVGETMNVAALTEFEKTQIGERQPLPNRYLRLSDEEMAARIDA